MNNRTTKMPNNLLMSCLSNSKETINNIINFVKELNKTVNNYKNNNNSFEEINKKILNFFENLKPLNDFENKFIINSDNIDLQDRGNIFNTSVWVIRPIKNINDTIDIGYLESRVIKSNQFVYKTIWKPVFGIIGNPNDNMIYWGSEGLGSFQVNPDGSVNSICKSSKQPKDFNSIMKKRQIRVSMTKSVDYNVDQFINKYFQTNFEKNLCVNNIKMINVFLGKVDIYPCLEKTNELDICAATAIGLSCGYNIKIYDKNYEFTDFDKLENLTFNKENMNNPYFIIF
jgi:hypothetical protein